MTTPTQRPASNSNAAKRRREASPAPTTDLCATAEAVAARCIKLHIHNSADPDRETSTYRQAAEVIGGLVDALRVREERGEVDATLVAELIECKGCRNAGITTPAEPDADERCGCPPCPGRGNDGHGLTHCAECCFGQGVEADELCPVHGRASRTPDAHLEPDADEREAAIRCIEGARETHVRWLAYLSELDAHACDADPCPWIAEAERARAIAGDADHHRAYIDGYDNVLAVLRASRTPDAHLAAAKAEALEEAADAWTEWEVYEDADGARSIRRRDVPLPSWLRARAARLREPGGDPDAALRAGLAGWGAEG